MLTAQQFAASRGLISGAAATPPAPVAFRYVTQAGDRWDTIAWKYYGDVSQIASLIFANPQVLVYPQFDAGVTIIVPLLIAASPSTADLPPWRQTQ